MMSFNEFLHAREIASTAFVEGDAGPLLEMSVTDDPASIFLPSGAVVVGAEAVNAGNRVGAAGFAPGASNRFEVLHSGADATLGYWVGVQRSRLHMRETDEVVDMDLRVTELFRLVGGEWLLFHRHADELQDR